MNTPSFPSRKVRIVLLALLVPVLLGGMWTWWAESHRDEERELRNLVQNHLEEWFPGPMKASSGQYGLLRHGSGVHSDHPGSVVLVHGLDEPGGIWHDLIPVLETLDLDIWEFRYPNDQAIERSVQQLAEAWTTLDGKGAVVMIGHSMGGLVIRDFVSRLRHPVGAPSAISGVEVSGVILVGTPSQGSHWARLRVWLEFREFFTTIEDRRFSLFAALRDGTGAAKVDLHPESAFLAGLNAREWPQQVPVTIIGGSVPTTSAPLDEPLRAIREDLVSAELEQALKAQVAELGEVVGDGAVAVASLSFPGGPPPILVAASHRGLLARRVPSDPEPPAIAHIVASIRAWEAKRE